jgi:hypothetical protein
MVSFIEEHRFQVDGLPVNRSLLLDEVDMKRAVVEDGQRLLVGHSLILPL